MVGQRCLFFADLTNPATFRDLSKPIGALNEERLQGFKVDWRTIAFVSTCHSPSSLCTLFTTPPSSLTTSPPSLPSPHPLPGAVCRESWQEVPLWYSLLRPSLCALLPCQGRSVGACSGGGVSSAYSHTVQGQGRRCGSSVL